MKNKKDRFVEASKRSAGAAALALLMSGGGAMGLRAQGTQAGASKEKQAMTATESKFYCNSKALTAEERLHHKQLGEKLLATQKEIVETAKGYEFQFSPADVTLAELADWVTAESKCCPFFDFHIDLENEGKLVCLRLTGEEGIKEFIRSEFQLKIN